jgi:hypothetical protein
MSEKREWNSGEIRMKRKVSLIGIVFLIAVFSWNWAQNERSPVLKGEYLGQKLPGTTPEIFAPGIVSTTQGEFNAAFSPDGKEFYFSVNEPSGRETMNFMTHKNNHGFVSKLF